MIATALAAWLLAAPPAAPQDVDGAEPARGALEVPATLGADAARAALDRALAWLLAEQRADGSWATSALDGTFELGFSVESFHAWRVASHALACLALLEAPETPERRAALERGLAWLCAARLPLRGSDWDSDYAWPALYGLVATTRAAQDGRFAGEPWAARLAARGRDWMAVLERIQSPKGGWAYYDDPPYTHRPTWDTSFCTALVLPALRRALELGWCDDPRVLERAQRYVRRCALPNGAYGYDLDAVPRFAGERIDAVKGSLGRIQVCNWGLRSTGVAWVTDDKLREGLEAFFRDHRFLDVARLRPIPHEAYYANAGYFYFFGHFYAARAIELLPPEEREAWHARLRPHLIKTQRADGSTSDFLASSYMVVASTSYLALALALGLPGDAP